MQRPDTRSLHSADHRVRDDLLRSGWQGWRVPLRL